MSAATPAAQTRSRFAVIIAPGLWQRRFEVTVEPPISSHPLQSFRSYADAITFADSLHRTEGWPIRDHCTSGSEL